MNRSTQKYWVVKTLSSKQTVVRMRHQAWTKWIYIVYFIIRENNKPRQYLLKVTNKHCSISLFIKFSNLKSPSSHNSPFPALRAVKTSVSDATCCYGWKTKYFCTLQMVFCCFHRQVTKYILFMFSDAQQLPDVILNSKMF